MNDDQLLQRLAASLTPTGAPSEPPAASLANLHRAIDAARPVRSAARGSRSPRALTLAVAAGVLAVVSAAFVIASQSLGDIDGEVAVEVTTTVATASTVESFELVQARAAADALEHALDRRDLAAVTTELERLRSVMIRLGPVDRVTVDAEVAGLLERADRLLRQHSLAEAPSSTATPTVPSTTVASTTRPPSTAAAVTVVSTGAGTVAGPGTVPATTAATGPTATIDADDHSGSNAGPGGGGPDVDDELGTSGDSGDGNSGPGGGGESGSGGGGSSGQSGSG